MEPTTKPLPNLLESLWHTRIDHGPINNEIYDHLDNKPADQADITTSGSFATSDIAQSTSIICSITIFNDPYIFEANMEPVFQYWPSCYEDHQSDDLMRVYHALQCQFHILKIDYKIQGYPRVAASLVFRLS
jgi:hypothetical protein